MIDTINLLIESHLALSYTHAFRFYLKGENKQSYFDCIVKEISEELANLDPTTTDSPKTLSSSFFNGLTKVMSFFSSNVIEENPNKSADKITTLNWFKYVTYSDDGMPPTLGEDFIQFQNKLFAQKEAFERLFKDHMPSIKAGLPEMPDEEDMGGFPEFFFE